jgi:hypothetical protein
LPQTSRAQGWALILAALTFLEQRGGDPMDALVNHCLEFDRDGQPRLHPLFKSD